MGNGGAGRARPRLDLLPRLRGAGPLPDPPPAHDRAVACARDRARSHCRFVLLLIHFIPYSLIYSVPLFLKQQCDRTLARDPGLPQRDLAQRMFWAPRNRVCGPESRGGGGAERGLLGLREHAPLAGGDAVRAHEPARPADLEREKSCQVGPNDAIWPCVPLGMR